MTATVIVMIIAAITMITVGISVIRLALQPAPITAQTEI